MESCKTKSAFGFRVFRFHFHKKWKIFGNMFGELFLFSLLGNGAYVSSKFENAGFMFSMFSFSNVENTFR